MFLLLNTRTSFAAEQYLDYADQALIVRRLNSANIFFKEYEDKEDGWAVVNYMAHCVIRHFFDETEQLNRYFMDKTNTLLALKERTREQDKVLLVQLEGQDSWYEFEIKGYPYRALARTIGRMQNHLDDWSISLLFLLYFIAGEVSEKSGDFSDISTKKILLKSEFSGMFVGKF